MNNKYIKIKITLIENNLMCKIVGTFNNLINSEFQCRYVFFRESLRNTSSNNYNVEIFHFPIIQAAQLHSKITLCFLFRSRSFLASLQHKHGNRIT